MRLQLIAATTLAAGLLGTAAWADDDRPASPDEVKAIQEALAPFECTFDDVDKEADNRFEVDDAQCKMGQYDFKLDGDYRIILMDMDD